MARLGEASGQSACAHEQAAIRGSNLLAEGTRRLVDVGGGVGGVERNADGFVAVDADVRGRLLVGEHVAHPPDLIAQVGVATVPDGDDAEGSRARYAEVLREQAFVLRALEQHAREAFGLQASGVLAELEVERGFLRRLACHREGVRVQVAGRLGDPDRSDVHPEHAHRRDDASALDPLIDRDLETLDTGIEVALREVDDLALGLRVRHGAAQDDRAAAFVDRLVERGVGDDTPGAVVDKHGAAGLPRDVVAEGKDVIDGRRRRCQRQRLRHLSPPWGWLPAWLRSPGPEPGHPRVRRRCPARSWVR